MEKRRLMFRYTDDLFDNIQDRGVCDCGHKLDEGEIVLGYPVEEDFHVFVCLSCHFWNVLEEAEAL